MDMQRTQMRIKVYEEGGTHLQLASGKGSGEEDKENRHGLRWRAHGHILSLPLSST